MQVINKILKLLFVKFIHPIRTFQKLVSYEKKKKKKYNKK